MTYKYEICLDESILQSCIHTMEEWYGFHLTLEHIDYILRKDPYCLSMVSAEFGCSDTASREKFCNAVLNELLGLDMNWPTYGSTTAEYNNEFFNRLKVACEDNLIKFNGDDN